MKFFLQYCALIFQSNRIGSQPTTTTPFAEAPLPIYGAPSQPFRAGRDFPRAGFGTRNRSGRIVKVLRRRKRKLNKGRRYLYDVHKCKGHSGC